jgi:hypothetical protein
MKLDFILEYCYQRTLSQLSAPDALQSAA